MELGMIGLGRMGGNMARRLLAGGHRLIVYDPIPQAITQLAGQGAIGVGSIYELVTKLNKPRAVWLMVPSGEPTEDTINTVASRMSPGDIIIDGGNSNYKDSLRRAKTLAERRIFFLDAGTSGGILGATEGYGLAVGGDAGAFHQLEPVLRTLAPTPQGYCYVGHSGAGHFVKTVHNGIEYALLQSYAEGFELLRNAPFPIDLSRVAQLWNNGGIIRSFILQLAQRVLERDSNLDKIAAEVGGGETGRWAVEAALDQEVPFAMTSLALFQRFYTRRESFAGRLVAALRQAFGGHPVVPRKK